MSLEIGESQIKAVEADVSKSKKRITALVAKDLSSKDPAIISEEIRNIFRSLKPNPQKIQLNIPRHLVTARFLRIPSTDDHEISKMLKIESIKHLPYTDEKVIYGYMVTEKMDDGYSLVLLVVAQSGVINGLISVFGGANIGGLKSLSLSSEGLFLWYMAARGDSKAGNVMLVNLDLDHADIDIIENDKLLFTRGIVYGHRDAKKIDKIASELNASANTYQKDPNKRVDRIILTGGKGEIAEFYPAIARESKIPVEIIEQAKDMPIDAGVIFTEEISFTELLGASLAHDDIKINLIPEEAGDESRLSLAKRNLLTTLALLGIIGALALGIFIKKMHDNSVYFHTINRELKKIEPKVAVAKKMIKEIGIIREVMSRSPLAIDIVSEIYGITPEGISLSMIDYEAEKSVSVRGSAPSLSDAFKYVALLENSPLFEGVKVKYANKRTVESKESADFEITAVPAVLK